MEHTSFKRCIFLLVDGARADVIHDLLAADELPHLNRFIVEPGTHQTATTVFPSTTGPAHAPFITGCTPGTCDIPGIRWFDRRQPNGFSHFRQSRSYVGPGSMYMDVDLAPNLRTVFDYFERPAGVFSYLNRGLELFQNRTLMAKSWYWFYAHYTGHWQAVDDAAWRFIARAVEDERDFIFAVFPAVDEYSHYSHPFSERTYESYRLIDKGFGRLVEQLYDRHSLDDTLFVLSSDHGLSATHTHLELFDFLEDCGLKTVYYPRILKNRCLAASMVSGNGMAHVYLRKGDTWDEPPSYQDIRAGRIGVTDLMDALLGQDAVDLIAARNEQGGVVVSSREGLAEIQEDEDGILYRVIDGDPFGYPPMAPRMTREESLEMTFGTDYPDAPLQLLRLLQSPRSGDIVISARKGYDLRYRHEHPEHKASHGSLHREHMHVPLLMNHPVYRPYVRTVDVFPSMLELMSRTVTGAIEGQSFVSPVYREGVNA